MSDQANHSTDSITLDTLKKQSYQLTESLILSAKLKAEELLVVGCSTSEVLGHKIGSYSSADAGKAILEGIYSCCLSHQIYLAAQCCEHLNRAIIIEETASKKYHYEPVNVIPQPKAGGSFATAAYYTFSSPVAVETINAHAGIDIGDTLIGMHLKKIAVPLRLPQNTLGEAHVVFARTRPKFIGGKIAIYNDSLF